MANTHETYYFNLFSRNAPGFIFLVILILAFQIVPVSATEDSLEISSDITTVSNGNDSFFIKDLPLEKVPDRIALYNLDATHNHIQAEIISCDTVIDIPGGNNHSYGAICLARDKKIQTKMAVCNDEMVGHFKIESIRENSKWAKRDLVKFVMRNCFGG